MSFYFPSGKRIMDKRVVFCHAGTLVPASFLPGVLDMVAGKSIYYKGFQY